MAPVALTCDGKQTILYLDGKQVDKADTATAILPGAIGVHDVYYTFGGLIDEVRVWRSALPEQSSRRWMNRPVKPLTRHLNLCGDIITSMT